MANGLVGVNMEDKGKKSFLDRVNISANSIKSAASSVKEAANSVGITADNIKDSSIKLGKTAGNLSVKAGKAAGSTIVKAGDVAISAGSATVDKIKQVDFSNYTFDVEDVLRQVMNIPGVKVDRKKFLRKELSPHNTEDIVNIAISKNPAYAGIEIESINKVADEVINYETNKVSSVSFLAGLPGGFAMAATIPGDVIQYFVHVVIIMQKLAYLYGFDDFELNDFSINDDTFNQIMIFLGVMSGVQGTNAGVKIVADAAAKKVLRSIPQKALTKGTIYPIVKKVTTSVGLKMTKDIFAKNISKVVPVVGGVVSGGITYAMFKPGCRKLQKSFKSLNLSNPKFYKDVFEG